ncbi:ferredoxin reductase [Rathayibacter soli]|uniref:ferredoxin reductase n=1 Tax=Rathayibacter soli TaxID=3144168 RepID=UPI0027E3DA15|nr:ferredoxin reductase [Glaciibacter superstes]
MTTPGVGAWRVGVVADTRMLTPSGRSILLDVPGWPGNIAGQHADVRLTAEDGYQAVRSYSLASVGAGQQVELAVDRLPDGEVSPYLVDDLRVGDQLEVRGPLGGWFVWKPELSDGTGLDPVQLIGGGSGIVPLIAMIRSHRAVASHTPFRLLYSVRTPEDAFFRDELEQPGDDVSVTVFYTRRVPDAWPRPPGRATEAELAAATIPAAQHPTVFVCGPTGFVEATSRVLVAHGHDPHLVKTERFGGG